MGRRGFPRVDIRDAWELAGGEGGTWVKATRSSGTSTWRHVCVCVGGWLWVGARRWRDWSVRSEGGCVFSEQHRKYCIAYF